MKGLKGKKLTQARLKEILDYDPMTGGFTRKVSSQGTKGVGITAGWLDKKNNSRRICVFGRTYFAHRLAFFWMEGYFPENDVDHIDRDPSNNKWENLREVSHRCNMRNRKVDKRNMSGVTGVSLYKRNKKWAAEIQTEHGKVFCGYFDKKTDAVKARWEAEVKYGFPNCNTTSSAYLYLKKHGCLRCGREAEK